MCTPDNFSFLSWYTLITITFSTDSNVLLANRPLYEFNLSQIFMTVLYSMSDYTLLYMLLLGFLSSLLQPWNLRIVFVSPFLVNNYMQG